MTEASVIEMEKGRVEAFEKEHEHLEAVKALEARLCMAEADEAEAKARHQESKKKVERLKDELRAVVKEGPPKPDPQGELPFVEDEIPYLDDDEEAVSDAVSAVIDDLDLTQGQKEKLAAAGCSSLADVVNLAKGNNPDYPDGLKGINGFGASAIKKVFDALKIAAEGTKEIILVTNGDGDSDLIVNGKYDAVIDDSGIATIQLPGKEPQQFNQAEYQMAN
ncbi:MAG: hypothetical protein NXI32_18195 [bacterium]|nr:hypothetical protein [bacterium]